MKESKKCLSQFDWKVSTYEDKLGFFVFGGQIHLDLFFALVCGLVMLLLIVLDLVVSSIICSKYKIIEFMGFRLYQRS